MLNNMLKKAHFLGFSLRIWLFVQNYASKSSSFVPFCVVCLWEISVIFVVIFPTSICITLIPFLEIVPA